MRILKKRVQFKDFIFQQPKQLTPQFCKRLIDLYETNPIALEERKMGGTVGADYALDLKQSEDMRISNLAAFKQEDKILVCALKKLMQNYVEHLSSFNTAYGDLQAVNYEDSGFQIQKTTPGGFYNWHADGWKTRHFTYIFYLNDIKNQGETEFSNGLKIKPEEGKGVIFPATWEYVHRGIAPKNEIKYITTGWVSALWDSRPNEPKNELK